MFRRNAGVSPKRERSAFNQTLQAVHVEPTARSHSGADFGAVLIVFLLWKRESSDFYAAVSGQRQR